MQLAFSVAIQFMVATVREGIHGGTVREGIHGGTTREEIHGGDRQRKNSWWQPSEKGIRGGTVRDRNARKACYVGHTYDGIHSQQHYDVTHMLAFTPNNIVTHLKSTP